MKISEITCKTALSKSGIYGWIYALNPYRGCEHACTYCYAPNILHTTRSTWGSYVQAKKNIPKVLAKELKKITSCLVGISSVTDPYQKVEEKYRLTRYCLEQLLHYNFPVSILTKSPLILRDIDLLERFSYSEITITITTLDAQLSSILEPLAPTVEDRLKALTRLSDIGFNTYAFLGPLLPSLDIDQVPEFIEKIAATGVRTVMVDTLNLKPGIWLALERSLSRYPEIKEQFHERLFVDRDYYPKMFELIKDVCLSRGVNFE